MNNNATSKSEAPAAAAHDLFQRQYGLGDLLSLAWKLFSENFKTILIVTLIIYVPIYLISTLITTSLTAIDNTGQSLTGLMITLILNLLAVMLVVMAIAFIAKQSLNGQAVNYQTALKQSLAKWLPGIGTELLMIILLGILFVLLIIPGIIFLNFWAFAIYAVILNNKYGWEAMKCSKSVVRGRWWRTFGYLVVFSLISGLINGLVLLLLPAVGDNFPVNFITSLVSDVVFSFVIVATVVLFLNLEATQTLTNNNSNQVAAPK